MFSPQAVGNWGFVLITRTCILWPGKNGVRWHPWYWLHAQGHVTGSIKATKPGDEDALDVVAEKLALAMRFGEWCVVTWLHLKLWSVCRILVTSVFYTHLMLFSKLTSNIPLSPLTSVFLKTCNFLLLGVRHCCVEYVCHRIQSGQCNKLPSKHYDALGFENISNCDQGMFLITI